jgi:hypothetical protein
MFRSIMLSFFSMHSPDVDKPTRQSTSSEKSEHFSEYSHCGGQGMPDCG